MAVEPDDAKFQSKLDEASKKKAKDELGEKNDRDREIAVQTLREWVLQQKLLKTPTDFDFLLRFVRARKYSLLLARDTLTNYWACKTKAPQRFQNIDPADETLREILKTGFLYSSKKTDRNGRRYVFSLTGCLDLNAIKKTWGVDNVYKAIVLLCEWLVTDENVQVNGVHLFLDKSDFTMGHAAALWSPDNGKKMVPYYQAALPCRIKSSHFYNEPTFFDVIFAVVRPMFKQKILDRMT